MNTTVQSVDRALSILETLAASPKGLGIAEISEKTELHKSTVHRLLATLVSRGYAKQDGYSRYKLTLKLFELGGRSIENLDMLEIARPYLEQIRDQTDEVVHLVMLEEPEIVYIDKVEPNTTIRMHSRIGMRRPLYCTAVGKAIMSTMINDELEIVWNNSRIEQLTAYTITSLEKMKEELMLIKKRGYSIDEEENEIGVRCVAIGLLDHTNKACGAISVSGPVERMTDEAIKKIIQTLIPAGEQISKELGYI